MLTATEAVQAVAPWWGVPVIAGSFAVGGVLAAQSMAWWLARKDRAFKSDLRWDQARLLAYSEFIASVQAVTLVESEMREVEPLAALKMLTASVREVSDKNVAVGLLGSGVISKQANNTFQACADVAQVALNMVKALDPSDARYVAIGGLSQNSDWNRAVGRVTAELQTLILLFRHDLGVQRVAKLDPKWLHKALNAITTAKP